MVQSQGPPQPQHTSNSPFATGSFYDTSRPRVHTLAMHTEALVQKSIPESPPCTEDILERESGVLFQVTMRMPSAAKAPDLRSL